jgi:hypothetical protein
LCNNEVAAPFASARANGLSDLAWKNRKKCADRPVLLAARLLKGLQTRMAIFCGIGMAQSLCRDCITKPKACKNAVDGPPLKALSFFPINAMKKKDKR